MQRKWIHPSSRPHANKTTVCTIFENTCEGRAGYAQAEAAHSSDVMNELLPPCRHHIPLIVHRSPHRLGHDSQWCLIPCRLKTKWLIIFDSGPYGGFLRLPRLPNTIAFGACLKSVFKCLRNKIKTKHIMQLYNNNFWNLLWSINTPLPAPIIFERPDPFSTLSKQTAFGTAQIFRCEAYGCNCSALILAFAPFCGCCGSISFSACWG